MNLYDYTPPQSGEALTLLLEHKNVKINRIVSSDVIAPTAYLQEEDEWFVLLKGKATILIENKEKILLKGDTLFIPANTEHKVLETQDDTVWLTVHIY